MSTHESPKKTSPESKYLFYLLKDTRDDIHRLDSKIDFVEKKLEDKIESLDKKFDMKIDAINKMLFGACGGIIISIFVPIVLHFSK